MQLKFFQIPTLGGGLLEDDLNAFLRAHRVLAVQRELVREGPGVYWALCVEYLPQAPARPGQSASQPSGNAKIDYREVLSAQDFETFSRLRKLRKEMAERDGVPVYAVFTNEQIAAMVTSRADSLAALRRIDGVGDARVEKYGEAFLAGMNAPAADASAPHEGTT